MKQMKMALVALACLAFLAGCNTIAGAGKDIQKAGEKALREKGADVAFPGFDRLRAEALETGPKVLLINEQAGSGGHLLLPCRRGGRRRRRGCPRLNDGG